MGRGRAPLVGLWLVAGLALSGTGTAQELSIANASVTEGDAGDVTLDFVVTLSPASAQTVTVQWQTADGSATSGDSDYVPVTNGLLTFAPFETSKTAQVTVKGDIKTELDETLSVALSNPSPIVPIIPAAATAIGTILNDDPPPLISVSDRQLIEGDSGDTSAVFFVTLTNPSAATVRVSWATSGGSASPTDDYTPGSGSLDFSPGTLQLPLTVFVKGDVVQESDETFQVTLSSPQFGTLQKDVGLGVILNDDGGPTYPGVHDLALVADGPSSGRIRLQWVAPSPAPTPAGVRIRWDQTSTTCSFPSNPEAPSSGVADVPWAGSGSVQSHTLTALTIGNEHCFSVWVWYTASIYSAPEQIRGRPFDSTGRVKFKYVTGATAVTAPTVGPDGVLVPSNDNRIHALARGPNGGTWPLGWKPPNLGSPVQSRSPIVPIAGVSYAYFATLDGWVHAIDAKTGARLWQTQLTPAAGLAAPAGIFKAFGGAYDYLLVGTNDSGGPNRFYALDPFTGAVIDYFPKAGDPGLGLGKVAGMATVDYATNRVYFGAVGGTSGKTLICLELGPATDALRPKWAVDRTVLGDLEGSPVLRSGRLYVGNVAGVLWSLDAANGGELGDRYSVALGSGRIKAFPWPDRATDWLYAMVEDSGTQLVGVRDTGTMLSLQWSKSVPQGSPVLMRPGTRLLYVGSSDLGAGAGGVFQANADDGSLVDQPLEPTVVGFGAPSLDGATELLYVGSEPGTIYAVDVSMPW